MGIYNYLFYKTYILAKYSKNFNDTPVLGGIIFVISCVMFNIFTIMLVIEGVGILAFDFKQAYAIPFAIVLVGLLLAYYYYNGRYKIIIEKYEQKERKRLEFHPILVIILYFGISFCLGMIAAMYKNQDWIFAQ